MWSQNSINNPNFKWRASFQNFTPTTPLRNYEEHEKDTKKERIRTLNISPITTAPSETSTLDFFICETK